uniref:Glycosyltransferase n=1 Tax=Vibrio coralliilyticus TaxID=190893 RepID=M1FW58_9VIBR|nr:hypothetical protein [Vibrio coralliilyticus]AFV27430.1 glycosyltransferase [Vibrio coralliilyticus]
MFKTMILYDHASPSILPAAVMFWNTETIPPLIPAPKNAGINGTKMFAIDFKAHLNGVLLRFFCSDLVPAACKTNVIRITEIIEEKGFKMDNTKQTFEDVTLFPREYFSPKDYYTREVDDTKNTYAIHQFTGSWL